MRTNYDTMYCMEVKSIPIAVYCRVSTLLGQSLDNQLVPLREYCERRGFDLVAEYCDEGQSGAKVKRPELDRMMRDARARKFKVLVVARLDRLGRNVAHLLSVVTELHSLGITFVSMAEGFDASTPQGQLTMTILAAVAEMERELVRARVREALAAKKAIAQATGNGWRCGRPSVITDEVVREVIELRSNGLSVRRIEAALDKRVSRATVERILKANKERLVDCLKNGVQTSGKTSLISAPESELSTTSKKFSFVAQAGGWKR